MPNKLVYVGFGYLHHLGGHAGYHQIKDYLDYDYCVDVQKFHNKAQEKDYVTLFERIRKKLFPFFCLGFTYFPWFLIRCLWLALTKGHLTFHFIYGENLYRNIKLLRLRGCKIVVTLHQPFEWFKDKPDWCERLKSVDHIILVGESEIPLFRELTGKNNVTFIPHGICSDFYCPDASVKKEKMILTVGNWLRDFEFANKVYQQILNEDETATIVIVSNPHNKQFITPSSRISFLSGITDEELRDLYRKTSCLFLPLKRYTANNALLEASAVGTPILIACNQIDNSYLQEDMLILLPKKRGIVASFILDILSNDNTDNRIIGYVQERYSWSTVACLTKERLESV